MAQGPKNTAAKARKPGGIADYLSLLRLMLPAVAALGIAQATLGVAVYGNASYAESRLTPDLSTIAATVALLVFIVILGISRKTLPRKAADVLLACGIGAQIVCAFCHVLSRQASAWFMPNDFALAAMQVIGNLLVVTYWLVILKDFPRQAIALAAFTAIGLSEAIILAFAFVPHAPACVGVGILSLGQIPLAIWGAPRLARAAKRAERKTEQPANTVATEYLGLMETRSADARFLLSNVIAAVVMSVAIGLLWGFPDGQPNVLSRPERAACAVAAILVPLLVARKLGNPIGDPKLTGAWGAIQLLGLGSLFLYALFPGAPVWGMAALYALNAVASAFIWCIAALLMRSGRLDDYCYGIGAQVAFLLPGAVARGAMMVAIGASLAVNGPLPWPHFPWDALIAGLLGVLIVLPVQLVMAATSRARISNEARMGKLLEGLTHALGLESESARPTDVRRAFMEKAAESVQREFGLSDREAEVLSLYALGMTQEKVAGELHVSPSTVHTHIAHIYTKTDLHSRQELLDYMDARYHAAEQASRE